MIETSALREKILELAIRGKLVPQDPNDEPASVLLERIRAEKQQMVKDGKLKAKDIKGDTIIFKGEDNLHYEKFADGTVKCIEDEIPFEVPDGWEWCRLSQIIILYSGQDLEPSRYNNNSIGIPYITGASNFEYGHIIINRWTDSPTTHATIDDLLLTCKGSGVGKMAWCNIEDVHIARQIMALRCINGLYKNYLEIVMLAFLSKIVSKANGLIPGLSRDVILNITFPLPPINEQTQIYHKSKEILSCVEQVDKERGKLIDIINITKSKILDLAIRGKLVPQDPNDEPASVLLERIRAEKAKLIRQDKIKQDKKESVIFKGEDNSYYDEVPKNWAVSTLNQLTHPLLLNDGDWILSENMNTQGEVKLIQLGSVGIMRYVDKGFKYLSESTFQELNCTQIYSGYMLINRIVSDKMCTCILPTIEGKIITTVDTCWVAPKEEWYNLKYLMYTLSSPSFQSLVMLNSGGTTRKRISKNNLINLPFAFPPLDEQHRIVKVIEAAFTQLDAIAESLN